jgi:hypothetical protein
MSDTEIYRIYLLRPGAKPRRHHPVSFEEVLSLRHLECSCYNDCLNFVARIPWNGFSCERCPSFSDQSS